MYIVVKRIKLVSGNDPLRVNEKYGEYGIVLFDRYYSSFEAAYRKMKQLYEGWLNACDVVFSDLNDHAGHICYKDDGIMYEIEYRVVKLTEEA